MSDERGKAAEVADAVVLRATGVREHGGLRGEYFAWCVGEDGSFKWEDRIDNVVVTVGANQLLDLFFDIGTVSSTKYMGLVASSSGVFSTADTMASHAGWTESTIYTNASRVIPTWAAASANSKASTGAVFNIGSSGIVGGAFMVSTSSAVGSTVGTLYSAGAFTGGPKVVSSGDSLTVTYTGSV